LRYWANAADMDRSLPPSTMNYARYLVADMRGIQRKVDIANLSNQD
jgi:hypothetical protein